MCSSRGTGTATEPAVTNVSRTDGRLLAAVCKVIKKGKTPERQTFNFNEIK